MRGRIYFNNGMSFRAAQEGAVVDEGEAFFAAPPDDAALTAAFPGYPEAKAEASRRKVPKSLVVQRLTEAGKIGLAKAALESDPAAFARWFAPGHTYVFADDPDALALLAAIGANADSIMAP